MTTRGLYRVYIVDLEDDTVAEMVVVARSTESAKVQVFAASVFSDGDYDDYDVFAQRIGPVRDAT